MISQLIDFSTHRGAGFMQENLSQQLHLLLTTSCCLFLTTFTSHSSLADFHRSVPASLTNPVSLSVSFFYTHWILTMLYRIFSLYTCSASSWIRLNSSISFSVRFSCPGSFSSSSRQSLPSWLSEYWNTESTWKKQKSRKTSITSLNFAIAKILFFLMILHTVCHCFITMAYLWWLSKEWLILTSSIISFSFTACFLSNTTLLWVIHHLLSCLTTLWWWCEELCEGIDKALGLVVVAQASMWLVVIPTHGKEQPVVTRVTLVGRAGGRMGWGGALPPAASSQLLEGPPRSVEEDGNLVKTGSEGKRTRR